MTYVLHVSNRAEEDIAAAKAWYECENPQLVRRFSLELRQVFIRIAENPLIYTRRGHFRNTRMRGFPYGIFYQIESHEVKVKAVLHDRRNPSVWQKRLT